MIPWIGSTFESKQLVLGRLYLFEIVVFYKEKNKKEITILGRGWNKNQVGSTCCIKLDKSG